MNIFIKYLFCLSIVGSIAGFALIELDTISELQSSFQAEELVSKGENDLFSINYDSIFYFHPEYLSYGFDYPVGKPDAENYYLASRFGYKNHLGEDWNGRGGGNTDLGDPVYVIGNGIVTVAEDICCGWGNVVRVVHKLNGHPEFKYLESVYAHLDKINVHKGQLLAKGQNLGTIGTAHGTYKAHLHLELRDFVDMSMGPGYSNDWQGYLDPSAFIRNNRHF